MRQYPADGLTKAALRHPDAVGDPYKVPGDLAFLDGNSESIASLPGRLLEATSKYDRYHHTRWDTQRLSTPEIQEKLRRLQRKGRFDSPRYHGLRNALIDRGELEGGRTFPHKKRDPLGMHLASLGALLSTSYLAGKGIKGSIPLREDPRAVQVMKSLQEKGIPVDVWPGTAAHFDPSTRRIGVDAMDSLATLLHEGGHATGRGRLRKVLGKLYGPAKLYGIGPMQALAVGTYLKAGDTSFLTPVERENRLVQAKAILAATSLPYVPVLAEEARASIRAVRQANKLFGRKAALDTALRMTPAFGTYLAGLGGTALGYHLLDRQRRKRPKVDYQRTRRKRSPPDP